MRLIFTYLCNCKSSANEVKQRQVTWQGRMLKNNKQYHKNRFGYHYERKCLVDRVPQVGQATHVAGVIYCER